MIQLRRLFRSFGTTRAVDDVSFEVQAGQVFGFIGPNGAGKTTTMRILATLDTPDYGDALVDGYSVILDPDRVRQRLGFMPDDFGTYPNMHCLEYLDFFARSYGLQGRARMQAIRRTLSYTGLDKIAYKPVQGLSKGMRQRLCLGRAMIHNPAVLILDEPANGLDPRARVELRQMILGLAAEGKSLLVSSHILTELGEMCDSMAIIERGKLIASGNIAEIRARLQPHIDMRVQVVDRADHLSVWLASQPGISHVNHQGTDVRFQIVASSADIELAQLLRAILNAGFDVAQYSTEGRTLEDVFMQITTGAIQ
ncbi:MAG: ABC transporter ATP-binding protein [Pirellulaceae bacterium]|nr:ABC transporter ATP-binding protein [Pirellulaceae bacterium]